MITEARLYREFAFYKDRAASALSKGGVEEAMSAAKLACSLAKTYYLCYEDDDLEEVALGVSEGIFPGNEQQAAAGTEGGLPGRLACERYVFYDAHVTDNVALTQQYLSALVAWKVPFLYLSTKSLSRERARLIHEELASCPEAEVIEIPECLDLVEKTRFIYDAVAAYGPSKAFVQATSDDIAAVASFAALKNVETYYIDLSDHGFWLGANAFDHYVGFRSYGRNVGVQHRGIAPGRYAIQPYYPVSTSKPYKGVGERAEGRVRILSGGRLEKIYGREDAYFSMVQKVLEQNPEAELYFAGGGAFGKLGQTSYIERQLAERDIENRTHLLGFRDDIVELMRHMDIYLGTYPMGGGLMTQIAATQGLPIVQYATEGLTDHVDEFLSAGAADAFVFRNDMEGFLARVRELVLSKEERHRASEANRDAVISKETFDEELYALVRGDGLRHGFREYAVDCEQLRKNQIDVENNCYPSFDRILVRSDYVKKRQPLRWLACAVRFAAKSDKRWLVKKLSGK